MSKEEIKALVAAKIAGQGSAIDAASVLPMILDAIVDAIPEPFSLPDLTNYAEKEIPDELYGAIGEKGGFIFNGQTYHPYFIEDILENIVSQGPFNACEIFANYVSYGTDKEVTGYTGAAIVDGILYMLEQ